MSNSDLMLARVLLGGFEDELRGHQYLADENEARRALVGLLRSHAPLDRRICNRLAALFDPDGSDERHLVFELRSGKRRTGHLHSRNTRIAQHVSDAHGAGSSIEEAVADAAEKFGVSEKTVWKIWGGYAWARERSLLSQSSSNLPADKVP
jgi:hypothetical protein